MCPAARTRTRISIPRARTHVSEDPRDDGQQPAELDGIPRLLSLRWARQSANTASCGRVAAVDNCEPNRFPSLKTFLTIKLPHHRFSSVCGPITCCRHFYLRKRREHHHCLQSNVEQEPDRKMDDMHARNICMTISFINFVTQPYHKSGIFRAISRRDHISAKFWMIKLKQG